MDWGKLIENLEMELKKNEGKKIVLTSRYVYLNKICIGLLKLLLGRKGFTGIYIAVDRPSKYTRRLLDKHGIPQDGLFFLDAISMLSNDRAKMDERTEVMDGPFCIHVMNEAMERIQRIEERSDNVDFIFLDNITVMLNYMDDECLYDFLGQFVIRLSKKGKTVTIVMVDKEAHPSIYKRAMENCDEEVEVPVDWLGR